MTLSIFSGEGRCMFKWSNNERVETCDQKQGDTYPVEGYRKIPSPLNKECCAKWGLTIVLFLIFGRSDYIEHAHWQTYSLPYETR